MVWTQVVTVEMLRREWIRFRRRLGDKRDRSCLMHYMWADEERGVSNMALSF